MTPKNYDLIGTQMPWWLVISCRNRWYLKNFVECGAGYGHTSAVACGHFKSVWSVEMDQDVFNQQVTELKASPNATRLQGSTLDHLPSLAASVQGPTLWYLDSHWPGMGPKLGPECPLLAELDILSKRLSIARDVIMIDNAGMFFRSPPPPHDPDQWPKIKEVADYLHGTGLSASFFSDVIIATPDRLFGDL